MNAGYFCAENNKRRYDYDGTKNYTVEVAEGGGFLAYYMDNLLCSAYGETPEEACEIWRGWLKTL